VTFLESITAPAGSVAPELRIGGGLLSLNVRVNVSGAEIRVGADLGSATITGDVVNSLVTARGAESASLSNLAIGLLRVSGDISDSQILAGYDLSGLPVNGDASIGRMKVNGNWTASDLVSGVRDMASDGFGNADDAVIAANDQAGLIAQIGAVVVKGTVTGSAVAGDHFGFVAQRILVFKHGTTTLPLDPSVDGQTFELGTTGDVTVREVAVT
jgi:hypothetical protein